MHWCSFHDGDREVARAKIQLCSDLGIAYPTWDTPPAGVTEIDLIEVAKSHRDGLGYGKAAVQLIVDTYSHPLVALSLDHRSDQFWRALGWIEHIREDDEGDRRLFTFPA